MVRARFFELLVSVSFLGAVALAAVGGAQLSPWLGALFAVLVALGFPYLVYNHDSWIVRPLVAGNDRLMLDLCKTGFVGRARKIMGRLPASPRCRFCLVPFGGVGRLLRIKPSGRNPNYCRSCFEGLPVGGHEMEVGVLFADIRGFTSWTESRSPSEAAEGLSRFYAIANEVLTPDDVMVEYVGDQVMALYLTDFPSLGERTAAVMLAGAKRLLAAVGEESAALPIGIGLNIGIAQVGNIGKGESKDFTAVGDVVNTAARLQSCASKGQIVLSEAVYKEVSEHVPEASPTSLEVKGKAEPVGAYVIPAGG